MAIASLRDRCCVTFALFSCSAPACTMRSLPRHLSIRNEMLRSSHNRMTEATMLRRPAKSLGRASAMERPTAQSAQPRPRA